MAIATLAQRYAEFCAAGLKRQYLCSAKIASEPTRVYVNSQTLWNFTNSDYLGLAVDPIVTQAAIDCLTAQGLGSGASPALSGYHEAHRALEQTFCEWVGRPSAVLFSSGYSANLAVLSLLAQPGQVILADRAIHASIIDGARAAGLHLVRFAHNDLNHLKKRWGALTEPPAALISESVFSMSGEESPARALAELAQARGCPLVIDDAHGLLVLGETGRGVIESQGLSVEALAVLISPLGKAAAASGALVSGSAQDIEAIRQLARPHRYSTALPPAIAAGARAAILAAQAQPERLAALRARIGYFRERCQQVGIRLTESRTPIQCAPIPMTHLEESHTELFDKGFWVGAIKPPTVPPNRSLLRISLTALHPFEAIDALVTALECSVLSHQVS